VCSAAVTFLQKGKSKGPYGQKRRSCAAFYGFFRLSHFSYRGVDMLRGDDLLDDYNTLVLKILTK
jgi:hypothetical protein